MKHSAAAVLVVSIVIAFGVGRAHTAPKHSFIPISWELDVKADLPQAIEVQLPGQSQPKVFWYIRYTVANHTNEDQFLVPEFTLYTDTGQKLLAGRGVSGQVFLEIKKRHNDPLMKDITGMTRKLLQGADNAKRGVAIWPDFDPAAAGFVVFIGGLSGETAEVTPPRPVVVKERGKEVVKKTVVLAKTRRFQYRIVGKPQARVRTPLRLVANGWVMR